MSTFGTMTTKQLVGKGVQGAFMGNGNDCNMVITAHDNSTAALNAAKYVKLELTYGATGTSTLAVTEFSGTNAADSAVSRAATLANLKISGIADPTAAQDVATKAYVDSHINDILNVRESVKAYTATQVSGQNNYAYTAGAGTITFDATAAGFSNAQAGVSLDVDGITLAIGQRILFVNAEGGGVGTGDDADGVYTLTSVGGAGTFTSVFTRGTDLNTFPIEKGQFVLVEAGAGHAGQGHFLNGDVAGNTTAQPWIIFSTTSVQNFITPIVQRGANYTVAGDIAGGDEGKVLIGGTNGQDGVGQWSYTVGKAGNAFVIEGTDCTVTEGATFTATTVTGVTLVGPVTLITATTSATFDSTGGETLTYGDKHTFATGSTGTAAFALPSITQARAKGCPTVLTDTFLDAGGTQFGGGLLLDQRVNFNGATNAHGGKYLLCPHNAGGSGNSVSLDIIKFDNSGAGIIVAQLTP